MRRSSFDITYPGDVFDSRDAIAKFEELDSDHDDLQEAIDEAAEALETARNDLETEQEAGDDEAAAEAMKTVDEAVDALKQAERDMEEWDDAEEYFKLKAFCEEGESDVSDWVHGATFIADSYFKKYAMQFAEDIGAMPDTAQWPATCIDWDEAAKELKADYSSIEVDGETYWVQN